MPSERATIGSSCDACESATSKLARRAKRRSAWSRPAIARALPTARAPPCSGPTTVVLDAVEREQLDRLRVLPGRDVARRALASRRRATSGRKNGTWGEFEMSIQTRTA